MGAEGVWRGVGLRTQGGLYPRKLVYPPQVSLLYTKIKPGIRQTWTKPWVTVISLGMEMELQGGGLANGWISQVVKFSIGRVCYQHG